MKRTIKVSRKEFEKFLREQEDKLKSPGPEPRAFAQIDDLDKTPQTTEKTLFKHASGATSSHPTPRFALVTGFGERNTALRFEYGNVKHEHSNNVLAEANWLEAARVRDHRFFQDRFGHVREHLKNEERGIEDTRPGGNLGAIGWYQDVASFLKAKDPEFYDVIRGLKAPGNYRTPVPDYSPGKI